MEPPLDKTKAKTVEKALRVLTEFLQGAPQLGIQDMSARTALPAAVVQRLVNSLRSSGFLEQDPRTKKYSLGVRTLELGATAEHHDTLLNAARPVMHEINSATRAGVVLTVVDRYAWRGAYISSLDALHPGSAPKLKQHSYLHACATRKILLAHLPSGDIEHILTRVGLPRLTPNTITDPSALQIELARIRARGFAVSHGELVIGTSGLAAPVLDQTHRVVASLGIWWVDSNSGAHSLLEFRDLVVRGAAQVSQDMRRLA